MKYPCTPAGIERRGDGQCRVWGRFSAGSGQNVSESLLFAGLSRRYARWWRPQFAFTGMFASMTCGRRCTVARSVNEGMSSPVRHASGLQKSVFCNSSLADASGYRE